MLALLAALDLQGSAPIHDARLAEDLGLPRTTLKRNLSRLAEDGFPVERTPGGWRANLADYEKLDLAVELLLSDRSRWGVLLASPFPRILPEAYLLCCLEILLGKVLTSPAVRTRITPSAIRAFVAVSESVPSDGLVREELPKALAAAVLSARDAKEFRDNFHALDGGVSARVELPAALIEACLPMLRLSPTLLEASLDPRPFGFARARFEKPLADDAWNPQFIPGLLTTVCTLIYDAESLLALEPGGLPAAVRPPLDRRGFTGRFVSLAHRLSRLNPRPDSFVAEAPLGADEIRKLADRIPDLLSVTQGRELLFRLRLELNGPSPAPRALVHRTNDILQKVDEALELR